MKHTLHRSKAMPMLIAGMLMTFAAQAQWNGSSVSTTTNSNVGIGTSSPGTDLHIVHNAYISSSNPPWIATKMHPAIKIDATTFVPTANQSYINTPINLFEINHTNQVPASLPPNPLNNIFSVRTTIDGLTGRVGVNKAIPTKALDVNGEVGINGHMTVNGDILDAWTTNTYNLVATGDIYMHPSKADTRHIYGRSSTSGLDVHAGQSNFDGANIRLYAPNESSTHGGMELNSVGSTGTEKAVIMQNWTGSTWTQLMNVYKNGDVSIPGKLSLGTGVEANRALVTDVNGNIATRTFANNQIVTTNGSGNLTTQAAPTLNFNTGTRVLTISNGGLINSSQTIPSGADNLGNHTATTSLNMGFNSIIGVTNITADKFILVNGGTIKSNGSGVDITSSLSVNGVAVTSDKRYKIGIEELKSPTDKLFELKAYTYQYNKKQFTERNFDDKKHFGFLAQEIEEVFPDLVTKNEEGYYAVNYIEIIPLMLQAMKEEHNQIKTQEAKIAGLEDKIAMLEGMITNCCNSKSASKNESSNTSSDVMQLKSTLEQNIPNPFSGETIIGYNIVEKFSKAFIGIYDLNGREIKIIPVAQDSRQVSFSAHNLIPGMYVYSLVVDNNLVDSKRMVVTN